MTDQRTSIVPGSPASTPAFALHMFAASLIGLVGLWHAPPAGATPAVGWRVVLVAIAAVAFLWGLARRFSVRALVLAGIAVLFAVSAGLNRAAIGSGLDSRYLFVVAVFAVLCAVEFAAGWQWRRGPTIVAAALVAIVCIANMSIFGEAGAYLRVQALYARADLGALTVGRDAIPRGYLAQQFAGWPFIRLPARRLLVTARALGFSSPSPAALPLAVFVSMGVRALAQRRREFAASRLRYRGLAL